MLKHAATNHLTYAKDLDQKRGVRMMKNLNVIDKSQRKHKTTNTTGKIATYLFALQQKLAKMNIER